MLLTLAAMTWGAEIINDKLLTESPLQYHKVEWDIDLTAEWENPYDPVEVMLDLLITSPDGSEQVQPCFYVSGESGGTSFWKARYMPALPGGYEYTFVLTAGGKIVGKTATESVSVKSSDGRGILHAHDLWTLRFDNGEPFRGIGENLCWESRDDDDSRFFKALHEDSRFNYDYLVCKLAENGGNFFRTWMIYWNLPVEWKHPRNNRRYTASSAVFNASGMRRMDHLVELCDSLDVHMMVAMDSHAGLLGGGWEGSRYNAANGGPANSPLEFFTLPAAKRMYKQKLRLMVARWGYSPAIGAWEFFNEVDNVMYNSEGQQIPDEAVRAWHDEMSTFLKRIDPYDHVVTTSISHRDIAGLNSLPNMDLNQKHIYRNTPAIPPTLRKYSAEFEKPYTIGEFGYEWDWSKNFNDFAGEMDSDFKRGLWYGLFSPTPILPMSWWWEFFDERGMTDYFSHVREIHNNMMEAGGGEFTGVEVTAGDPELQVFAVRCGNKVYVYVYNPGHTDKPVAVQSDVQPPKTVQVFDCDPAEYRTVDQYDFNSGLLSVNGPHLAPGQDMVLILQEKE